MRVRMIKDVRGLPPKGSSLPMATHNALAHIHAGNAIAENPSEQAAAMSEIERQVVALSGEKKKPKKQRAKKQ